MARPKRYYDKHEPTEANRKLVKDLYTAGVTQERICKHLDINTDTLCKYYREEMDISLDKMVGILAGGVYKDAIEGDKGQREFWLKTRGRWSFAKPQEDDKPTKMEAILEKLIDKL